MQSSRVERPEQLTLEVGGYSASVMSIAVTLVFVLVVGCCATTREQRPGGGLAAARRRRGGGRRRAARGARRAQPDAEPADAAGKLLIDTLASSRGALRETKVNLGALSRRQRQLASE